MAPKWQRAVESSVKALGPTAYLGVLRGKAWSDTAKLYAFGQIVRAVGLADAVTLIKEAR